MRSKPILLLIIFSIQILCNAVFAELIFESGDEISKRWIEANDGSSGLISKIENKLKGCYEKVECKYYDARGFDTGIRCEGEILDKGNPYEFIAQTEDNLSKDKSKFLTKAADLSKGYLCAVCFPTEIGGIHMSVMCFGAPRHW